jgi:FAD/FMN-containing dehydrogenase
LSAIVGESYVSLSASPPLRDSASPLRASPASVQEVSEVLKLAASEGWTVVPAGGETWLGVGNPLKSINIVLSTSRLNRLISHEPADLVASAEAGVSLSAFNNALNLGGQWLPLDPPDNGTSTIGGVVATGLSGPHRYGFGAPRNFVIGMKIVLADGRLIKAGGNVVKNVAGYDLCKLFTGSYGTLGMITELTFKLRPLPRASRTVIVWGKAEALMSGAQNLLRANLFPTAIELLSPVLAYELEFADGEEAVLLVRFQGSGDAVEKQCSDASVLLEPFSREGAPMPKGDFKLWERMSAHPMKAGGGCVWRANVPPVSLRQFISKIESATGNESRTWQASAATGQVRGIESSSDLDQIAELLQWLREEARSLDGSLTIENSHRDLKKSMDSWGGFGTSAAIMQRIKMQLDPRNTLSPGRFNFAVNTK